jgi:hypothetical protein
MISVLVAVGLTAIAIDVVTSGLPWWAIVAVAIGAPLLWGAILLGVLSRVGNRASPPPSG